MSTNLRYESTAIPWYFETLDGYTIDCITDYGIPCSRITVGTDGTVDVILLDNSTKTIPALGNGANIDIQASAVLATGTANNVIVWFNRFTDPKPAATLLSPDGYAFDGSGEDTQEFKVYVQRPELVESIYLYNSVDGIDDGYGVEMTLNDNIATLDWAPTGTYPELSYWFVVLTDVKSRKITSRDTLYFTAGE